MISRSAFVQRLGALEQRYAPRQVEVPDACTILRHAGIEPDPWQIQVAEAK
jgi:hypothetical protein